MAHAVGQFTSWWNTIKEAGPVLGNKKHGSFCRINAVLDICKLLYISWTCLCTHKFYFLNVYLFLIENDVQCFCMQFKVSCKRWKITQAFQNVREKNWICFSLDFDWTFIWLIRVWKFPSFSDHQMLTDFICQTVCTLDSKWHCDVAYPRWMSPLASNNLC